MAAGHQHRGGGDGGTAHGDRLRWISTVARQEYRLSIRNRWAFALVGLFAAFALGAVGLGLAFLALGVLVSAAAAERTHALGAGLGVWVWFVFAHDLLALGALTSFDLPGAVASAFVLANPADVFRVLVLGATGTAGAGTGAALASTGLSVPVAVAALVAWWLLPVALAGRLIARRRV